MIETPFDEALAAGGPRFDPETGKPINPDTGKPVTPIEDLNRVIAEQGGNAEILAVEQVGQQDAQWYFTVRSRRTGEPVELKSLETKKLETLSNLAARVREADGGRMPRPRAGSDKHSDLMDAIDAAKEMHVTGASEKSDWRRILGRYMVVRGVTFKGRLIVRDLSDVEQKRAAIDDPHPFGDPAGFLHVNAEDFLGHLEDRRTRDVSLQTVTAGLKLMGFVRLKQVQAKTDGINATKRFWRAPEGFDWGSDG